MMTKPMVGVVNEKVGIALSFRDDNVSSPHFVRQPPPFHNRSWNPDNFLAHC